jgi:hypothetical protein
LQHRWSRGSESSINKARDGWITTLYALGQSAVLDKLAPPKALRLMAADVVAMHRHYGSGDLDPDTKIWNILPKPWLVMDGSCTCTRAMIEDACTQAGVTGNGWIAPRERHVAPFAATPELVHGVIVSSPELASQLRKLGYFSGPSKNLKGFSEVHVEKHMEGDVMVAAEVP